jgi:hypothetical protein
MALTAAVGEPTRLPLLHVARRSRAAIALVGCHDLHPIISELDAGHGDSRPTLELLVPVSSPRREPHVELELGGRAAPASLLSLHLFTRCRPSRIPLSERHFYPSPTWYRCARLRQRVRLPAVARSRSHLTLPADRGRPPRRGAIGRVMDFIPPASATALREELRDYVSSGAQPCPSNAGRREVCWRRAASSTSTRRGAMEGLDQLVGPLRFLRRRQHDRQPVRVPDRPPAQRERLVRCDRPAGFLASPSKTTRASGRSATPARSGSPRWLLPAIAGSCQDPGS